MENKPQTHGIKIDRSGRASACLSEADIANYLFNPITEKDRFRIEKHITECDLCYDAIAGARLYKSKDALISHAAAIRMAVEKKYTRSGKFLAGQKLKYYTAAAVMLISFSSLGYWMLHDPSGSLADEFLRPYSNTIPLARGQAEQNLLEEAMSEYEVENYALAADKLALFLQTRPDHDAANLYCGISKLLRGEAADAVSYLQKAEGSSDTRLSEAARWYRALAYLKSDQTDDSKMLLTSIGETGGYFTESARSVLNKLKAQ